MPRAVLKLYPIAEGAEVIALGSRGGFSGAQLWRGHGSAGDFCLRAWPAGGITASVLGNIHHFIDQAGKSGLEFVPKIHRTRQQDSFVFLEDRFWDMTSWMPGEANFHRRPSSPRLANACTALAQIHEAWKSALSRQDPCPAVLRRLEKARQWQTLVDSGWRPEFSQQRLASFHPWAERAWVLLRSRLLSSTELLRPWGDLPVSLQPCLCDIWHDHVLFTGDTVTGIVDYGSVKLDHVAVDLARLLGSMVGDDAKRRTVGLDAYSRLRNLSASEVALVDVLDRTGTLLAAANWLRWIYHEGRSYEDMDRAALRLVALVQRLES